MAATGKNASGGAAGEGAPAPRWWPAADDVDVQGPLAHVGLEGLDGPGEGANGAAVRLRVLPVTGLLALRGDPERSGLADAVRAATGLELPGPLGTSVDEGGDTVLRWRSPDEWLLSCPIDALAALGAELDGALGPSACAVDVSGGYALFELAGDGVDDLLRRSMAYDVTERGLPPGKAVSTAFAKTTTMLRRIDAGRVELVVRRSYADYVWTWLQRAAGAGGLAVEAGEAGGVAGDSGRRGPG